MTKILIAYNDEISDRNSKLFEDHAIDVINFCIDKGIDFKIVKPPQLVETEVTKSVLNYKICYIASHGTTDAIKNENNEDIVSTTTTNYNFYGKALFTISCDCAQTLKDELIRIGLKLFVGYKSKYQDFPDYEEFYITANSGIKLFSEGVSVSEMRKQIYMIHDKCYDSLCSISPLVADALLDNREGLTIEGDDHLCLSDL